MPHVSVVIPLFDTERYIGAAIESVLAQTFADFELIVIDDGSRDLGPAIARSFGDARVRVVTQTNRGLAGARNSGIRESRGDLVALLDADDRYTPEKLARHVAQLAAHPDLGVSFSASRLIDADGHPLGLVQRPQRPAFGAPEIFCRNPVGNGSAPVIRRSALDAIAFPHPSQAYTCWFDESFRQSEDIECWLRIAATTPWRFGYVDAELTEYRITRGGLSANTAAQLATWRRFRAKVAGYAPALERAHGCRAEAYQLRYLARRMVHGGAGGSAALAMMASALRLAPAMLAEEPVRTATTLAAALARAVLPAPASDRLLARAMGQASRRAGMRV